LIKVQSGHDQDPDRAVLPGSFFLLLFSLSPPPTPSNVFGLSTSQAAHRLAVHEFLNVHTPHSHVRPADEDDEEESSLTVFGTRALVLVEATAPAAAGDTDEEE
jgi:hypothetical protein